MKNNGFILAEALLAIFITSLLALLCLSSFKTMSTYDDVKEKYDQRIEEKLKDIYE